MQIFILFYLFLWTDTYVKSIKSSTAVFEHCGIPSIPYAGKHKESRDVYIIFIEIIFSRSDMFDSNIKIFW